MTKTVPRATADPQLPALTGLNRRTAHEAVRDVLRHAILNGDLAPDTPLILTEIAEQLGVSRTPVREAIRDLATEGLVDFDAYRSAYVHVPTVDEAREIYELRIVLEGLAVRAAVPAITDRELDRAEELCDAMDATNDTAEWAELNRQFHATLMGAVASKRLGSIVGSLRDASAPQVARSIRAGGVDMSTANAEHRALLASFREGNVEAAVERQTVHLHSTLRALEEFEDARAAGTVNPL
jgi:DNA-binding GntR family transcriptional regulator